MELSSNTFSTILFSLSIVAVSFLRYLGVFKKITFQEETIGPFKFLYRNGRGQYREVGPLFEATIKYFQKMGFKDLKTGGIYYDDPEVEPSPRYAVGFIIETDEQEEQFKAVKDSILKEFRLLEVKETKTISSHFPIKFQALSCMLSAMKTYSAFKGQDKYKASTGCLEIYTDNDVGTYFPQNNLMQFWPKSS